MTKTADGSKNLISHFFFLSPNGILFLRNT
jgi:hypothetical protein